MSDRATLVDPLNPSGAINFLMSADWQPVIDENAGLFIPLDYGLYVKSSAGTLGVGGILSIVSENDEMDQAILILMQTVTPLTLTMPNGDTYTIMSDPQNQRKGSKKFSLMSTPWPINLWTFYYKASS